MMRMRTHIFGRLVQIAKVAEYYEYEGVKYADVYLMNDTTKVMEIRVEDIELY